MSASKLPAPKLGGRVANITPSATVEMAIRVIGLRNAGVDIVNLALGEPDFDTPVHIRDAAKRALDGGATRYTDTRGTLALREAIGDYLEQTHGIRFALPELMVSSGAKQLLFNMLQVLLDEGDEVIVPIPSWTSYPDLITAAGGRAILVDTSPERGYVAKLDDLERARTARTRAIIICSPGNPTGAIYSAAALAELAAWAAKHGVMIISDDIYRALSFNGPTPSISRAAHDAGAPYVIIDGVSKMYAMTGFRIGFGAAHPSLITAMTALQGQSTSCPAAVSQAAALAALKGPQECVAEMRDEFARRARRVVELLRELPRVKVPFEPQGAFYAFPDVRAWMGARTPKGEIIGDDKALVRYLLDEAHVAIVPGSAFSAPGFVRVAYATSIANLEKGMKRVGEALAKLTPP